MRMEKPCLMSRIDLKNYFQKNSNKVKNFQDSKYPDKVYEKL
jgi:hypothetical protein